MDSLLIVEDDIAYSTMMQTWLKKKGFDVDKVSSVKDAVKIINSDKQYHLVLSDLRLPDHDGLFLLELDAKERYLFPQVISLCIAEQSDKLLQFGDIAAEDFPLCVFIAFGKCRQLSELAC